MAGESAARRGHPRRAGDRHALPSGAPQRGDRGRGAGLPGERRRRPGGEPAPRPARAAPAPARARVKEDVVVERISGLKGTLGYVRAYRGRTFVVKLGGEILGDARAREGLAGQIGLLHSLGIRIVVVHGGGPQATSLARRLGHEPTVVAGRRVTDDAQLEVAKMVFAGSVHVDLLAEFRRSHVP